MQYELKTRKLWSGSRIKHFYQQQKNRPSAPLVLNVKDYKVYSNYKNNLRKKIKDLVTTKADKEKTIVIIPKKECSEKMNGLIEGNCRM